MSGDDITAVASNIRHVAEVNGTDHMPILPRGFSWSAVPSFLYGQVFDEPYHDLLVKQMLDQIESLGWHFAAIHTVRQGRVSNQWLEHAMVWLDHCAEERTVEPPDELVLIKHNGKVVILRCGYLRGGRCQMLHQMPCAASELCHYRRRRSKMNNEEETDDG